MDSAIKKLQDRLSLSKLKTQLAPSTFKTILWALGQTLIATAIIYPQFRMRLKERNLIAQIKARGG